MILDEGVDVIRDCRRTVSNLLQSDFGARLGELLMQSYVNRQYQAFESQNEVVDSSLVFIPETEEESEIINGFEPPLEVVEFLFSRCRYRDVARYEVRSRVRA